MSSCKTFQVGLPKKRMAAGALFFDSQGKLLIVKPTYKDSWEIPGGIVEKKESPREACMREVQEELGLDWQITTLLCVDYSHESEERTESLQFIFLGGPLSEKEIAQIRLPKSELSAYQFLDPQQALPLLNPRLRARVEKCLENQDPSRTLLGSLLYLEDGRLPSRAT